MSKKQFFSIALVGALFAQASWSNQFSDPDVRGVVEQWAPAAATIKVSNRSYPVAKDVQVTNGNAKLISPSQVRAGARVLLMLSEGTVTHVILNPGSTNPFERPGVR